MGRARCLANSRNGKTGSGRVGRKSQLYRNVSIFTPIRKFHNHWYGVMQNKDKEDVFFPVDPFLGIIGTAPNTSEKPNSIPPGAHGGNLDVAAAMGVGSKLDPPVQVAALCSMSETPTARRAMARSHSRHLNCRSGPLRLTLLKKGDERIPGKELSQPFGETDEFWIPIGLNPDLNEAMKDSVRQSIGFLSRSLNMDRATAFAYLSAATDFNVSQVVDRTKGVHSLIRRLTLPAPSVMREPPLSAVK